VIAVFRTPAGRITLYITLSVLIHAIILWLPYLQFHHDRMQPPPLTVRLEPLPKPITQPVKLPEPATPLKLPVDSAPSRPATETLGEMDKTQEMPGIQKLPKNLQLTFALYQSGESFQTGEINHHLEIRGNKYTLQAVRKFVGISSLQNTGQKIQTSRGKIGKHGVQPEIFVEETITKNGTQRQKTTLDQATQTLRFSNGSKISLPANTQDILSFMYQISQLLVREEFFELPVIDGSRLEQFQIEIGVKENISTPMGELHALRLRKIHKRGEAYFEIWLGLEYRLLPVKFRLLDALDNVIEETLITDIRASDT
jgi:Protein of unknown function (DUF3108)